MEPWIDPDGMFVLAPSYMAGVARDLHEGKSLGTARDADLILMDDPTMLATLHPQQYAKQRKVGVTVGRRVLLAVQEEVERDLLALVQSSDNWKIEEDELRKQATKLMRKAWKRVFLAGVRSGGLPGTAGALKKDDLAYLKGAVTHEMRYLNRFLTAVVDGTWKMPLEQRVRMYVNTLTAFYESARVISLPATSLIRWSGPDDKKTCASCAYLFENNDYTKASLPGVPRSGISLCLSNCRDRLLIRRSTPEKVLKLTQESKTRQQHLAALQRIKREDRS